jgi:beta-lactamase superfamily II metal-dependent hydrolase
MVFAAYPSVVVYKTPGDRSKRNAVQHLIWGDWIKELGPCEGDWVKVNARRKIGWMQKKDIQENRLLELDFVDIGQGDGCLVGTPEGKVFLVDAGEGDNLYRFLSWRFDRFKEPLVLESAIISHPDKDHFGGLKYLADEEKISFGTIFHNGIVERAGKNSFGTVIKQGNIKYLVDVIVDRQQLLGILDDPLKRGKKVYANLLKKALDTGRIADIRMLCSEDGFLPGYEEGKALKIQVLGPVPEKGPHGERMLRRFGSDGETVNGHSVILRLCYGNVVIMLGGDLNVPSEKYLLSHYTGLDPDPTTPDEEERLISFARRTFESDIAKACHHGSADLCERYLQAVNSMATVISSGDNESYSHPRPDALGAIGKYGRGIRPLIFSTELARSAKETIKHPYLFRKEIRDLAKQLDLAETEADKELIRKKLEKVMMQLERSIAVYGMINVRTDGEKAIVAQKLERPRSKAEKWDIYELEPGPDGKLCYKGH